MTSSIKHQIRPLLPFLALALIAGLWIARSAGNTPALAAGETSRGLAGFIHDQHGDPVSGADVKMFANGDTQPIVETRSQPDGAYLLVLPDDVAVRAVRIVVERPHFFSLTWQPTSPQLAILLEPGSLLTNDVVLRRRIDL